MRELGDEYVSTVAVGVHDGGICEQLGRVHIECVRHRRVGRDAPEAVFKKIGPRDIGSCVARRYRRAA